MGGVCAAVPALSMDIGGAAEFQSTADTLLQRMMENERRLVQAQLGAPTLGGYMGYPYAGAHPACR